MRLRDERVPVVAHVRDVRKGEVVKILGTGDITVAVQITANKFSASAKDKIAAAGGSTTEI